MSQNLFNYTIFWKDPVSFTVTTSRKKDAAMPSLDAPAES
jgi:hypothetical protein